ncbi:MAG TPA: hypothetical protein VK974_04865 [Methylophilaceae bacterium]|nr:hypothetical protein [Methylophilaceae bacterium]
MIRIFKEKPILFSAPMVRAILDGSKTQTRRMINPQPFIDAQGNFCWNGFCFGQDSSGNPRSDTLASPLPNSKTGKISCPYGKQDDQLWVKETWQGYRQVSIEYDEWEEMDSPKDRHDYDFKPVYRADGKSDPNKWLPSIFMPREFSRIQLEIVSVRVERLNDCSPQDAIDEGIHWRGDKFIGVLDVTPERTGPVMAYQDLWESINGAGSWDKNPWVWVIEFKVVKP